MGLQKWFRSVKHYGRLAGYSEHRVAWGTGKIDSSRAWTSPESLLDELTAKYGYMQVATHKKSFQENKPIWPKAAPGAV